MIFESVPVDYSSINDSLVYVAYDAHAASPSTYPNYKYVAEVWINGVKKFTGKYFPNPTNNRGIIDIGNVVREYVSQDLNMSSPQIIAQRFGEGEWSVSVVVKIREEYSGTVGAVVLTDSTRVMFNHYNGRFGDWTILDSYIDKPLTTRGSTIDITYNCNNYFIPYFAETTTPFNVVITGGTSTRTLTVTPTAANQLQLFNVSPGAINLQYTSNFSTSTTSYAVSINGTTYNFRIVCEGLYGYKVVHFINKFGGFESMLFNKVAQRTYTMERKNWKQLPYRVSNSGNATISSANVMYQQTTQFYGNYTEKMRLNTDILSDADLEWMSQLMTSPVVYVQEGTVLYPVVITANNYAIRQHIVDGLKNVAIDVDFGVSYKTQFK